jgi:3D (Asp-Asp-Asp) domain-containing protein
VSQITSRDPEEEAEMTATAYTERRELAHRTSDGIEVTLFWSKATNRVTIAVLDSHSDEGLEFDIDGSAALDAFMHPYAYAATTHARNLAVSRVGTSGLTVGADRS